MMRTRTRWTSSVTLILWSCSAFLFNSQYAMSFVLSKPFFTLRNPLSTTSLPAVGKTGAPVILSEKDFEEAVHKTTGRPVMIFWTAPWCGPCRLSIPVVKEVIKQFSGQILAAEVCTDDLPEMASDAGVVSIPTIQIYVGGQLKETIIGLVTKNVLANAVDKILEDVSTQSGVSDPTKGEKR